MNKIKELRLKKNLNMRRTAELLGIPYTTYINYEKGEREPNSEMLVRLADFFGVSVDTLIGREEYMYSNYDNIIAVPDMRKVPLIGTIACGSPILAVQNVEAQIDLPDGIKADFALRCKGDSMINARIFDGDIVYISAQPDVENGEIAAVIVEEEATLKRVYKYPGRLELRPENPTFPVLNYEGEMLNSIRIIGKAVAFTSIIY